MFFICADGKKTALVSAVRTFLITADRDGWEQYWEAEVCFTKIGETCGTNLRERRYSVIEKHLDISKTILKQLSRLAVIRKKSDSSRTNSVYLPSAQMKNERHNPIKKS